jgi:hypothetical protein
MVSSINDNTSLASTAAALIKPFDSNGDGQLSSDEFVTLLTRLASLVGPAAVNGMSTRVADVSAPSAGVASAPFTSITTYRAMAGWDERRLNDPTDRSTKNVFARGLQDLGLTERLTPEELQSKMIPYLRANGFPDAIADDDVLWMFGANDPFPQDVIFDVGGLNRPQFINTPQAEAYGLAHPEIG